MTNKSLIVINGTLFAGLVVVGCVYLGATVPLPKEAGIELASKPKAQMGEAKQRRSATTEEMAPSERVLSDSELERQKKVEGGVVESVAEAQEAPRLPLVMLEPGPDMGWDEAQAAMFQDLRDAFAREMSADGHSPSSPEYLEHWMESQAAVDAMLRLHLGEDAFVKLDSLAARAPVSRTGAGE